MKTLVREPTLPLDVVYLRRRVGYRSRWPVRLKLWWLGLTMRAQGFSVIYPGIWVKGWKIGPAYYVTFVEREPQ